MGWKAITESDLLEYMSGGELESFRRATTRPGEGDPVAGIIARVTSLVRGYILQCPRYTLGGDGTVPDCLIDATCSIIIVKIMARAGGGVLDQSGERKKASDAAMRLLADVSKGLGPTIQLPTSAEGVGSEVAPPGVIGLVYQAPLDANGEETVKQFTLTRQDGV